MNGCFLLAAASDNGAHGKTRDHFFSGSERRCPFEDKHGLRAWKSHNWDVLFRRYERGYIDAPVSKAKSVMLTDEGAERSKRLFEKHFMKG